MIKVPDGPALSGCAPARGSPDSRWPPPKRALRSQRKRDFRGLVVAVLEARPWWRQAQRRRSFSHFFAHRPCGPVSWDARSGSGSTSGMGCLCQLLHARSGQHCWKPGPAFRAESLLWIQSEYPRFGGLYLPDYQTMLRAFVPRLTTYPLHTVFGKRPSLTPCLFAASRAYKPRLHVRSPNADTGLQRAHKTSLPPSIYAPVAVNLFLQGSSTHMALV